MNDETVIDRIDQWLAAGPTYRDQRRYLEAHPAIVAPLTVEILTRAIAAQPPAKQDDLRLSREIIRYALARGGAPAAIHAAYVNARGGFTLDLPGWLDQASDRDRQLAGQGRPDQVARARVDLWQAALARAEAERLASPILAQILISLSNRLNEIAGADRAALLEQRIAALERARGLLPHAEVPYQWAMTQNNLGNALSDRIRGDRAENLDEAIAAYRLSLQVYTRPDFPVDWAMTQNNLGNALSDRIRGDRAENLDEAIAAYRLSLEVRTRTDFPIDHRVTQENLALAHAERLDWPSAHAAYRAARAAERDLLEGAVSHESRRDLIAFRAAKNLYLRDARACLRMVPPDAAAAIEALEEGRAQGLRAALALDAVDPAAIADPAARARMVAFVQARDAWQDAQRTLAASPPGERDARQREVGARHADFSAARDAIRRQDDPEFLAPLLPLAGIARALSGRDAALVYLAAGPEGGLALGLTPDAQGAPQPWRLPLPALTGDALDALVQTDAGHDGASLPSGGFAQAQMRWAFGNLRFWGESASAALSALPEGSGFAEALRRLRADWAGNPKTVPWVAWLDTPFTALSATQVEFLAGDFTATCGHAELERALPRLGDLALTPLAEELGRRGARRVALVPYGLLALFPLPAAPVALGGQALVFGAVFETTVAPSARALSAAHERAGRAAGRDTVLAVGNPRPLYWPDGNLPYAEAEADTVARVARRRRPGGEVLCYTLASANRANVLAGLRRAWYAHLALHGHFDHANPRAARLILQGEASVPEAERVITLGECLDGAVDLRGLAVLVLSACETAIIEARAVPNEVVGLAAAFMQAGARAVLAALWPVDDRATFLLMSRFANLLLDARRDWPAARCLAEAQRWLREEATNAVLRTYDPLAEIPLAGVPYDLTAMPTQRRDAAKEWDRAPEAARRRILPRYDQYGAMQRVREQAAQGPDDARPYREEQYWAAFTVTGE